MRSRRRTIALAIVASLVVVIAAAFLLGRLLRTNVVTVITGAVIAQNEDPHLQRPIAKATVKIFEGENVVGEAVSEPSGLFHVNLNRAMPPDDIVIVHVEHPDYHPYQIASKIANQLYILRLAPKTQEAAPPPRGQESVRITNIRVRYATRNTITNTVGTAVRTINVKNAGNVPCGGKPPCSPDGKWKAAIGSLSLDTGEDDKQFRNVRVSCVAGPCPFSAVEDDRFSRGGRSITIGIRNWSDTVTYLLEAEVAHTMESELIRHTYPITFGRSMNFTLPTAASGPSIEAEVDGTEIVFPLGPELILSWATCRFQTGAGGTKQYRCELKPGYQFQ